MLDFFAPILHIYFIRCMLHNNIAGSCLVFKKNKTLIKQRYQALTNCVHCHNCACKSVRKQHYAYTKILAWYQFLCKNNLNLPISHKDYYYASKKRTTTTTFLISNTVFPNPCSHKTVFDPQSFTPLILNSRFI